MLTLTSQFETFKSQFSALHPQNFSEHLLFKYGQWIITKLTTVHDEAAIRDFLTQNWTLVQGSCLCPTAIPNHFITQFLIHLATMVDPERALSCLMPGIALESTQDCFPPLRRLNISDLQTLKQHRHLSPESFTLLEASINTGEPIADEAIERFKQELNQQTETLGHLDVLLDGLHHSEHYLNHILNTHILSQNRQHLIPIKILTLAHYHGYHPYSDTYTQLEPDEWQRLYAHSKLTQEWLSTQTHLKMLQENTVDLLSHLQRLLIVIRREDAHHGRGRAEQVGEPAFKALCEFSNFYQALTAEQMTQIPTPLNEAIQQLLRVSSAYERDMIENMETCAGTRREAIETAMQGHEALLTQITLSEDVQQTQKQQLLQTQATLTQELKISLQQHTYTQGHDNLGLSIRLCQTLQLEFSIERMEDLQALNQMSPTDIAILLTQTKLQHAILNIVNDFDKLCGFVLDFPTDKLAVILKTLGLRLLNLATSSADFAALIAILVDEDKIKLLSCYYQYSIVSYYLPPTHVRWVQDIETTKSTIVHLIPPLLSQLNTLESDEAQNAYLDQYLHEHDFKQLNPYFWIKLWFLAPKFLNRALFLLQYPEINCNAQQIDGATPLMLAIDNNRPNMIKDLIQHPNLDINIQDSKGNTALMRAMQSKHPELLIDLIQHPNIDMHLHSNVLLTALSLSSVSSTETITSILLSGPNIHASYATPPVRKQLQHAFETYYTDRYDHQDFLQSLEFLPIFTKLIAHNQGAYNHLIHKLFTLTSKLNKKSLLFPQDKYRFAQECMHIIATASLDFSQHRNIALMILRWLSIIIFPIFIYYLVTQQLGPNLMQTAMDNFLNQLQTIPQPQQLTASIYPSPH